MLPFRRFFQWFHGQRNSTRLSFLLQIICRIGFSICSFIWTPLLLGSMGKSLNGLFLNFQKITSLGGLGDLGMGDVVNIRTSRLLGQGREPELRTFLATVRGNYLVMAILSAAAFFALSPLLLKALKFAGDPQVGSLPMMALVGGIAIAFVILNSYINNVNYGSGNTAWPVVPTFLLAQFAILGHWLLARQHYALWEQYIPYVVSALLIHGMGWFYAKISFPSLATVWPLNFNRKQSVELLGSSFWVYLSGVATGIWFTTDILLITARFGPQIIPAYQYNSKLCEIAMFFVNSANLMSAPKITQWMASSEPAKRERGIQEMTRVNQFQTLVGCCATLIYLEANDTFMKLWLGRDYLVPLYWQAAFVGVLAVTGAGMMGTVLSYRCCDKGIRYSGVAALLASVINFGLAFAAVESSSFLGMNYSIFGVALFAVVIQSAMQLYLVRYAARQLNLSWWKLTVKHWLLALATLAFGLLIRIFLPPQNIVNVCLLIAVDAVVLVIILRVIGIRLKDLRQEMGIFISMFKNRSV
jgi:O-antigen/teichoic acid export membrane protein